jgi:hypothetical protein
MICQLDVVHNWPSKWPKNSWIKNCFCFLSRCRVIQMPQNGMVGVSGLKIPIKQSETCALAFVRSRLFTC